MNSQILEACAECDLLLNRIDVSDSRTRHCPRCGYTLRQPRTNSIERTLVYSTAGLGLILPANLLPMLGIQIMGNTRDGTLWSGVTALFNEGMWGLAVLVFLASMVFPTLKVIFSMVVSGHLYFNRPRPYLTTYMRYLHHLEEWAMLEVYTLGIIVACVKLAGVASLEFGYGLYAFTALLIINCLLSTSLDYPLFWERIIRPRR